MEVKAFCTVSTEDLRRALVLPGDRVSLDYAPDSNLGVPLLMVNDTLVFARAGGDADYGKQSFTVSVERSRLRDLLPADAETVTLAVDSSGALHVNGQAVAPKAAKPAAPTAAAPKLQAVHARVNPESARVAQFIAHLMTLSAKHYGTPRVTALSVSGSAFTVYLTDARAVDVSMDADATAFVERVFAPAYRERRHVSPPLPPAERKLRQSQMTQRYYDQLMPGRRNSK